MTPYATKYISEEDVLVFREIKTLINRMPDIDLGVDEEDKEIVLSSHILSRAIAKLFDLRYQDGYFLPNYEHSWVLSPHGHLIDVYPVGIIGGPFMMQLGDNPLLNSISPVRWHYKATSAKKISQGRFSQLWFRRSVRRVEGYLRELREDIIF